MPTGLEIRRCPAGEPPATDLVEAMVAEMAPLYGRIDVPHAPSATPEQMSPPGGSFLVIFDASGAALAGGGLKRLDGRTCEIKRMYTVPQARGRGIAKLLLGALEDEARRLGYAVARLDTGPRQPHAQRMYEAAGYRPIGNFNSNPFASFWGEKELNRAP